jgi:hypothetical protein
MCSINAGFMLLALGFLLISTSDVLIHIGIGVWRRQGCKVQYPG